MTENKKFLSDFKKLISIDSVLSSPKKNAPFGKGVKKAYDCFMKIAKKMGFKTIDYDGYAGEIVYGEGEEIGIIGHMDVVPTGNGWTDKPFKLVHKNGAYYGRGTSDDKGPMLITLYALNELKNEGVKFNRKIRLFVGCDEETGWRDVDYLLTKTTLPDYGFSPDGNFPVSYAEKGILISKFYVKPLKNFYNIKGGTVVNAVCDKVECVARDEGIDLEKLKKHNLTLNGNVITSIGKSAHGSLPQLGKNAITPLFEYFLDMGEDVKNVLDCLFYDKYGVGKIENEQGKVTLSPDIIYETDGKICLECDCRIPAPATEKDVKSVYDKFGIEYKAIAKHPPVLVEKDGWFVNTLLSAYNEVTGKKESPISMGGSTFARAFKHGCAFGAEFIDDNPHMHEPDERMSEKALELSYKIYKKALYDLVK